MTYSLIHCRASSGTQAPDVEVETHLSRGLPGFSIVGLPEKAVQESRDRVRAAIINSHYEFPTYKITVNLAPADLPKEGSRFDLAIALGILAASGQIPDDKLGLYECYGELSLSGEIRPVTGLLPAIIAAFKAKRAVILQQDNTAEASTVPGSQIYPARYLSEVCNHLHGNQPLQKAVYADDLSGLDSLPDIAEIQGQKTAKRGLFIAAAGGHSMLMIGPPGTGKTMLANRLPSLLPQLSIDKALETAAIHSIAGLKFDRHHWRQPPFRAPHHSSSAPAIVGGGTNPKPGEVSLAHNGVLFLDELPEFNRSVLESLREPLENGRITISRAGRKADYLAAFQLVSAMNPCPCGFNGHPIKSCVCTYDQILKYRNRISGPVKDRIDIHIEVPAMPAEKLVKKENDGESSEVLRKAVVNAHNRQLARQGKLNARLEPKEIDTHCRLDEKLKQLLIYSIDKLQLSHRAYHRVLKLARTIADSAESKQIQQQHITEAIQLRILDRGVH